MPEIAERPESQTSAFETEDPNRPSNALQTQAETAYERILNAIFRRDLLPTEYEPSSEIILQNRFDFGSRMPIRMALAVLASEGLIAQRARYGFWVVDYTDHDLRQIGRMRADADAMVTSFLHAGIADGTINAESCEFQAISNSLRRMDELANIALEDNAPSDTIDPEVEMEFANNDTLFHASIAEATNYTLAAHHIHRWRNLVRLYRVRHDIHYTAQHLKDICAEHNMLLGRGPLPVDVGTEGTDAMIEKAATSHVANSLVRCKVGLSEPRSRLTADVTAVRRPKRTKGSFQLPADPEHSEAEGGAQDGAT